MKKKWLLILAGFLLWVIPAASLFFIWNQLPSNLLSISLAVALILLIFLSLARQLDFPKVVAVFFVIILVNFFQTFLPISQIIILICLMALIVTVGLSAEYFEYRQLDRENFLNWFITGFLTAQISSILIFWPFTFVEKSILVFIGFYMFYQYLHLNIHATKRSVISHFAFALLAVMLVLGLLIWIKFPQLKIF